MNVPSRELMPVICAALKRGQCVRMTVNGSSMLPFIYDSDVVELEPIHSLPTKGDIALVQCSEDRYVMHRVVRVEGETLFLRGDAQLHCEGPFTFQNISGKVTMSLHNGFARTHNRGIWRLAGLLWIRIYKVALYIKFIIRFPRKCASRIWPRDSEAATKCKISY